MFRTIKCNWKKNCYILRPCCAWGSMKFLRIFFVSKSCIIIQITFLCLLEVEFCNSGSVSFLEQQSDVHSESNILFTISYHWLYPLPSLRLDYKRSYMEFIHLAIQSSSIQIFLHMCSTIDSTLSLKQSYHRTQIIRHKKGDQLAIYDGTNLGQSFQCKASKRFQISKL